MSTGELGVPTAFAAWPRGLLIALLLLIVCGFNLFANPMAISHEIDQMDDIDELLQIVLMAASVGVVFSQPILLAVWMAFANVPPVRRITAGLLLVVSLCASIAAGLFFVEGTVSSDALMLPLVLAVQVMAVFPLLAAVRRFTRWRLDCASRESILPIAPGQFGMRSVLVWTFEVGLLAGLFQFLYRHLPENESRTWATDGSILFMAAAGVLFSLPVVAAAWMVLGRRLVMLVGAAVTFAMLCMSGAVAYLFAASTEYDMEAILMVGSALAGMMAASMFVYFILRGVGYRMTRLPRTVATATTADLILPKLTDRPRLPKLSWQFAMAMFIALAACGSIGWRASQAVPHWVRVHQYVAETQRWADLGLSVYIDDDLGDDQFEVQNVTGISPQLSEVQQRAIQQLVEFPPVRLSGRKNISEQLESLAKLGRVRNLNLAHAQVFDADLATIGKMIALESLDLSSGYSTVATVVQQADGSNTTIPIHGFLTDAGFAGLAKLTKLKTLDLSNTPITDAGLAHLHVLKSLKSLDLRSTKVTAEGVQRLRKALPNAEILWEAPPNTESGGPSSAM